MGTRDELQRALANDRLVDISTTGRKSGRQHRIEIAFHRFDGNVYISGLPGRRDWYANVVANPKMTFHLKQSTELDIPARAVPLDDGPERERVMHLLVTKWDREGQLDEFLERSPLIRVELELETASS